jgi:hypothetical protein
MKARNLVVAVVAVLAVGAIVAGSYTPAEEQAGSQPNVQAVSLPPCCAGKKDTTTATATEASSRDACCAKVDEPACCAAGSRTEARLASLADPSAEGCPESGCTSGKCPATSAETASAAKCCEEPCPAGREGCPAAVEAEAASEPAADAQAAN